MTSLLYSLDSPNTSKGITYDRQRINNSVNKTKVNVILWTRPRDIPFMVYLHSSIPIFRCATSVTVEIDAHALYICLI